MKPLLALLVLSMVVPNKCDEKERIPLQISPISVRSVVLPDTVQLGQPIHFETTCSTPTPCWQFKRFEISRTQKLYTITVFAECDGQPCIQVIGSLKAGSSVVPQERGTYTLRFWHSQDRMLDMIVVVQ